MNETNAVHSEKMPPVLTRTSTVDKRDKLDLLAHDPPVVDNAMASNIAERLFGIKGDVVPLSAEKDANFLITLRSGEKGLLKITNAAEDPAVTDMQSAALMHLATTNPSLPVQRICASLNNNTSEIVTAADGQTHIVRLLTFLDGTILSGATHGPGLHHELGAFLARITLGLRGFFHPAAGHYLQWDIKQAGGLRPMLEMVEDAELRGRLTEAVDRFDADIAPRLLPLRAQVLHNDFNPHNVLVDGPHGASPVGLIDFGDIVHTPVACDLAVACSYQIGQGAAPLRQMCDMISGYAKVLPLEHEEIALLPDLIRMRHATTLAIGASRAQRYPENATYILRNAAVSLRGMNVLDRIGDAAAGALHVAAGTE